MSGQKASATGGAGWTRHPAMLVAAVHLRRAVAFSLEPLSRWERVLAVLTGCLAGTGLGLPISRGDPGPVLIVLLEIGVIALVAGRFVPAPDRRRIYPLVALAFGARLATAALLHDASVAIGRGGAIVGDDGAYADLAWSFVQWLRGIDISPDGPPDWSGQAYLFGTFVYLESLVFFVLGGRQVLAMEFLNAGLAAGTLLLLFSLTRRLFGQKPAIASLVITAFYPSLMVWSALNLKDALVLLLVALVHWIFPMLQARPRLGLLALVFILAYPFISMRLYIFVVLLAIVPMVILVGRGPTRLPLRLGYVVSSAIVSAALLFSLLAPFVTDPLHLLDTFEVVRSGLSSGARTGFVSQPTVVRVSEGDTLYVPLAPGSTPDPSRSPAVVFVGPETRIIVITPSPIPAAAASAASSPAPSTTPAATLSALPSSPAPSTTPAATLSALPSSPAPSTTPAATTSLSARPSPARSTTPPVATAGTSITSPTPGATVPVTPPAAAVASQTPPLARPTAPASVAPLTVFVRPGDVVVVGPVGTTPAPDSERKRVPFTEQRDGPIAQLAPAVTPVQERGLVLDRTLSHIPRGVLYALLAPFPWEIRRTADLATVPEMLVWYVIVCVLAWSLVRLRRSWRELTALTLYVAGLFAVFALAEGNVGILYRHRSMIVPFVVVLASPGVVALVESVRRSLARRRMA